MLRETNSIPSTRQYKGDKFLPCWNSLYVLYL